MFLKIFGKKYEFWHLKTIQHIYAKSKISITMIEQNLNYAVCVLYVYCMCSL